MKKINELLIVLIFILTAVLAAAVGLKAYDEYDTNRRLAIEQEEMELAQVFARNQEAQNRVLEMEAEIRELTQDAQELERFIIQIQNSGSNGLMDQGKLTDATVSMNGAVSGNTIGLMNGTVSENVTVSMNGTVSENATVSMNGTVSGNATVSMNGTVSGNTTVLMNGTAPGDAAISMNGTASGNAAVSMNGILSENAIVSMNGMLPDSVTVSDNHSVSGNFSELFPSIFPEDVSANEEINYYDGSMTENSIFDPWRIIYEQPEGMSLAQRRELRTSLQETLEVNQSDRERIASDKRDFSDMKIACLGDSITAASNLEGEEDYQQYSYPARLKELLNAKEVYNLGIGGSSIGRYWADAYVDRYQEIPDDVDVIIVMGGTNDGFCVSDKEFGNLEERAYRTFCGDLDELMRGLHEHYPDAEIFFATPLPNILQDYLMSERDYLLPQQDFVDVILALAREYDYEVIDLYNSNILDSHDANVVAEYIPDGVHGNHDGYQIMAEHFAAEIIEHYEKIDESDAEAESKEGNGSDEEDESEDIVESNEKTGSKEITESDEEAGSKEITESDEEAGSRETTESEETSESDEEGKEKETGRSDEEDFKAEEIVDREDNSETQKADSHKDNKELYKD